MEENKKIYIIEKNVLECLGNCRRLVEKNKLYKIEKFNSVFSTDEIYKENSIWEGKFKTRYLKAQLEFCKVYLNLLSA